jgi:hypothetical protein
MLRGISVMATLVTVTDLCMHCLKVRRPRLSWLRGTVFADAAAVLVQGFTRDPLDLSQALLSAFAYSRVITVIIAQQQVSQPGMASCTGLARLHVADKLVTLGASTVGATCVQQQCACAEVLAEATADRD